MGIEKGRDMVLKKELPIMIGHNLHKGLVLSPNEKMGGYDLTVVWLDKTKDIPSGEPFAPEDVLQADAVIHFCDKESVRQTKRMLEMILADKKDQTDDR